MNTLLSVLLALAIFVTLCDATCYVIPLETSRRSYRKGCKDNDNIIHKFNTKWISRCEICSCHQRIGIHCCSKARIPLLYDTIRCKEIFDIINCRYKVVMKTNPRRFCKVFKYLD